MNNHTDGMGVLGILWESTVNLHKRFGVTVNALTAARNFREESNELLVAQVDLNDTPEHVAEEMADVIVTAMGIGMSRGVTLLMLIQAVMKVAAKNNRKTWDTHFIDPATGKITRRPKSVV